MLFLLYPSSLVSLYRNQSENFIALLAFFIQNTHDVQYRKYHLDSSSFHTARTSRSLKNEWIFLLFRSFNGFFCDQVFSLHTEEDRADVVGWGIVCNFLSLNSLHSKLPFSKITFSGKGTASPFCF
jgi:hypothetical protein